MIYYIDKLNLYNTFNIKEFTQLEEILEKIAPSLAEYYLNEFLQNNFNIGYLNKKNIEKYFYIGKFILYLDYNKDVYMEDFEINHQEDSLF